MHSELDVTAGAPLLHTPRRLDSETPRRLCRSPRCLHLNPLAVICAGTRRPQPADMQGHRAADGDVGLRLPPLPPSLIRIPVILSVRHEKRAQDLRNAVVLDDEGALDAVASAPEPVVHATPAWLAWSSMQHLDIKEHVKHLNTQTVSNTASNPQTCNTCAFSNKVWVLVWVFFPLITSSDNSPTVTPRTRSSGH